MLGKVKARATFKGEKSGPCNDKGFFGKGGGKNAEKGSRGDGLRSEGIKAPNFAQTSGEKGKLIRNWDRGNFIEDRT